MAEYRITKILTAHYEAVITAASEEEAFDFVADGIDMDFISSDDEITIAVVSNGS
jgi:hypothetical protein